MNQTTPCSKIETSFTDINLADKDLRWVNISNDWNIETFHEVHNAIYEADVDDYMELWGIEDEMTEEEIEEYKKAPEEIISIWDGHKNRRWALDGEVPQEQLYNPEVLSIIDNDSDMSRDYALIRDKWINPVTGEEKFYYYVFISGHPRYPGVIAYNSITRTEQMSAVDFTMEWLNENGF